ncbi:MAG TPA: hypothetical protein VID94_07940 [Acidimicrobiales bacterium]
MNQLSICPLARHRAPRVVVVAAALGLVVAACGDDGSRTAAPADTTVAATATTAAPTETSAPASGEPVIDPGDGGNYAPELDPADFVAVVDNPYLPFVAGSRWTYEETNGEGQTEDIEIVVLDETREIAGITATVVRDTVTIAGVLVEDTHDFYAQDVDGNVWYLGEEVDNYENGDLVDHEGSFEVGVDGAYAGIVMEADPQVGDAYRQEYYPGEAEDMGEVLRTGETVSVPGGDFTDVIVTRDWNPLEPDIIEEKYFAPGVGQVREATVAGESGDGVLVDMELVPAP